MGTPNGYDGLGDLARELSDRARDVAYVTVGLGVLGIQRAQAQRRELVRQLRAEMADDRLGDVRTAVASGVRRLDAVVGAGVHAVETALHPVEDQIPTMAREAMERARSGANELREQLRRFFAAR